VIGAVLATDAELPATGASAAPGRGAPSRAATELAGRPLAGWPAAALAAACDAVAIVGGPGQRLPELEGVERWEGPADAPHTLGTIAFALERAGGPVMVCAADMPFVTADACRSLLTAATSPAGAGTATPPAVVAVAERTLEPLLGIYAPAAREHLRAAPSDASVAETVEGLDPLRVAMPARVMMHVRTREELAAAEDALATATEPTWRRGREAAGMP
jgi:molybdopterin-guanine dinucleotide biosynthesis protein A